MSEEDRGLLFAWAVTLAVFVMGNLAFFVWVYFCIVRKKK